MHKHDGLTKYTRQDVIDYIHMYGLDINKREIYLFGREETNYGYGDQLPIEPGVDYMMSNQFIKNLRILQSLSSDPILIHMKTCGGMWEEGMAIYDAIKACHNYVVILNYTHARSMSSLIFQAADWRVMMPYSTFMFHTGTVSFEGTGTQYETEYQQYEKTQKQMVGIYVDVMQNKGSMANKKPREIRAWVKRKMKMKEEVYFSAAESIEYGFADLIFGADGMYDWKALREEK